MMEYMLPDSPADDVRGALPNVTPQLMKEIEADVQNKRVHHAIHICCHSGSVHLHDQD